MIRLTSTGEETNLLCRKIPNNLLRYSTLKVGEHSSPFCSCGLQIVTAFQYGKEEAIKESVYGGEI